MDGASLFIAVAIVSQAFPVPSGIPPRPGERASESKDPLWPFPADGAPISTGRGNTTPGKATTERKLPPPPETYTTPARSAATAPKTDFRDAPIGSLAPVRHQDTKTLEPKKLAKAVLTDILAIPNGDGGQPLTLFQALSRSAGRVSRTDAVKGYWSLTAATAEHAIDQDALRRVQQLADSLPPDQAARSQSLAATFASLKAQEREAAIILGETRYRLATYVNAPQGPLHCAEVPHVGGYRMEFERIFASRPAPPNLLLLHRTLPLRHRCVELRAEAVQAAHETLEAATDAHRQGRLETDELLAHIEAFRGQRRAFVREVREYNNLIADYALGLSGDSMDLKRFVPLLIQSASIPAGGAAAPLSSASGGPGPVLEEVSEGVERSILRTATNRKERVKDGSVKPATEEKPADEPPPKLKKLDGDEAPMLMPVPSESEDTPKFESKQPKTKTESPRENSKRLHFRPIVWMAAWQGDNPDRQTEPTQPSPSEQTRRIAQELYARLAPPGTMSAAPTTLAEFLRAVPTANRRAAVTAYWTACEKAARYRAFEARLQPIDELCEFYARQESAAGEGSSREGSLTASWLAMMRWSAAADEENARIDLLLSCFQLTLMSNRPATGPWLWPSTPPNGGPFPLVGGKSNSQRSQLEAVIAASGELLFDRGNAMMAAETAAAAALDAIRGGGQPGKAVLWLNRAHHETLSFLGTLTRCNLAYADYLAAVAPPDSDPVAYSARLTGR